MIEIKYNDEDHRYWIKAEGTGGWLEVPSVTTVLEDMSSVPALPWWGMRVGMAAAVEAMAHVPWADLANAHTPLEIINPQTIPPERRHYAKGDRKRKKPKSLIEAWTVDNRRSTNHVADDAGDRGTAIHTVLEMLALDEIPNVERFPADQRGWIAGLVQWYLDQEPTFLLNEVMVASAEHRYAGRFDSVVMYPDSRIVLLDLKTSKGVYKKHLRQLALYEAGFEEMGLWPNVLDALDLDETMTQTFTRAFDALEVLHITAAGEYHMVPSLYRPEHVLPTVTAWHADRAGWLLHADVPGLFEDVR